MLCSGSARYPSSGFVSTGYVYLSCPAVKATSLLKRTIWTSSSWLYCRRTSLTLNTNAQHRKTVVCTTDNGDWDKFQSRASESLQNTGRFLQSSTGQAVLWGGLIWLVLTGRIGWIFDSFLYLLLFFSVAPIVGVIALRWWLNRQLVQGTCPSCGARVAGLRNQPFQCISCGQMVRGENGGDFSVNDPASATIDIDAKTVD